MKKTFIYKAAGFLLLALILIFIGNITVSTKKGIDYKWSTVQMPLYLKILDFFDRHYNYKLLTKSIVNESFDKQEQVIKILKWVSQNIKRVPQGMPIVDDHVWNIIIRGYGARDQHCDVFSVLCNYAGMPSFFTYIDSNSKGPGIPLSFVKIGKKWTVFDPYQGVYFLDRNNQFADAKTIGSLAVNTEVVLTRDNNIDYSIYFGSLDSIDYEGLHRSNLQSPLNRLKFAVQKHFHN